MENSEHGSRSLVNLKLIRVCVSKRFSYYMFETKKDIQKDEIQVEMLIDMFVLLYISLFHSSYVL